VLQPTLRLFLVSLRMISLAHITLWRICSGHCWAAAEWARSSACAAQKYCGSISFVSAHVPFLYNACASDVTKQCVGIRDMCFCDSRWRNTTVWRMFIARC
jgi:hypothetical protein